MLIRRAETADLQHVWQMFRDIIAQRIYYPYNNDTPDNYLADVWIKPDNLIYIAEVDGVIAGAYIIRPNQLGWGAHIANAAYMVDNRFRSQGIGKALGEHSLQIAKAAGYRAMQYNFVISTNTSAVRLWQSLGFDIIGAIPEAFLHPEQGYVDAYIMYRKL